MNMVETCTEDMGFAWVKSRFSARILFVNLKYEW